MVALVGVRSGQLASCREAIRFGWREEGWAFWVRRKWRSRSQKAWQEQGLWETWRWWPQVVCESEWLCHRGVPAGRLTTFLCQEWEEVNVSLPDFYFLRKVIFCFRRGPPRPQFPFGNPTENRLRWRLVALLHVPSWLLEKKMREEAEVGFVSHLLWNM